DVIHELSVANEEMRRGRAVLEWAERQHHQLMQLVLDEVELPDLVAALASALRASVTVEDTDGRVLASAPAEGYCPPPAPAARRSRPPCGCPSWPGPRPSRVRSRWPGPTTGRTSCCCPPIRIPVTRCAASWPRPTRRSGRGAWSPSSPGRWPGTRPGTRPRSGSPAARWRC